MAPCISLLLRMYRALFFLHAFGLLSFSTLKCSETARYGLLLGQKRTYLTYIDRVRIFLAKCGLCCGH